MKAKLERKKISLTTYHTADGDHVEGPPARVTGNLTGVWGDLTGVSGNLTGVWGNLTGVTGDFDKCEITQEDRDRGISIDSLVADTPTI